MGDTGTMFGLGSTVMFFKIRGSFLGVSAIKIIVLWGLYRGPTFWETTIYTRIHKDRYLGLEVQKPE